MPRKTPTSQARARAASKEQARRTGADKPKERQNFRAHETRFNGHLENEEQLRQQAELLELTQDAVLVRDLDQRITFWNHGAELLYGWTRYEALGQPMQSLLHTQFARPLAEIEADIKQKGYWEGELVHTTREGRSIQVASRWSLQRNAKGKPIAILQINTDITERKRAEAEIRRLNAELVARISDRTVELELSNQKLQAEIAERQKIEDELRHAEQQANDLIRYAPTGIFESTIDPLRPQVVRVNDALCQMSGYTREEFLAMNPFDVLTPEGQTRLRANMEKYRAGEEVDELIEYTILTKDGRERFALIKPRLIVEQGIPVRLFVIAHDITERKHMEDTLRQSEARFKSLYQSLPYLAMVFQQRGEGLVLTDYNQAAIPFTQGGIAAMVGQTARELYAARPETLEYLERAFAEQTVLRREGPYQLITTGADKYLIQTFVYVPPDQVLLHVEDITERKRAEEALRESEERFRAVLENSMDAAYRFNFQTNRYDYVSPVIEQIVGFSAEEFGCLEGEGVLDRVHPDDQTFVRQVAEGTVTRGLETGAVECRFLTKAGQYRWLSDNSSVLRDAAGHPLYRVGIIRDVTERRQTEERIQNLNRDLKRHAAELAAANQELESFSYSVSHDLRTPLGTVDVLSQSLQQQYGTMLPEQGQRYLELVRTGTKQMDQLITSLLSLSRLSRQPVQKQPVNMTALVGEALQTLQGAARPGLTITVPDLPEAEADPVLLKQVWVNLLANAVKFTRKNEQARIEIGCGAHDGEKRAYYVRDNGVGFDMEQADQLFGVFRRLHDEDEYEGMGIGLATVARIIHRHGGRVWAEGKVGEGATFYFTLG